MTEAEFLERLRTLPLHPGAHGLTDDTATLGRYTITTDTLVEGVHYLPTDPPGDVAWKLLAQNLSDLAAKGATPVAVLLNYPLRKSPEDAKTDDLPSRHPGLVPGSTVPDDLPREDVRHCGPRNESGVTNRNGSADNDWDAAFLSGLAQALHHFATPILGGDTVSLPPHAPRVITLTAIGDSPRAPLRSGAQAGDALWVTGTLGNAGAGLAIAQGKAGPAELLEAYRRPRPRLAEGRALAPHVHAMMDVSDGLLIDARRMAAASNLTVTIDLAAIPLSPEYIAFDGDRLTAATAGDDYQLLFAAAAGWTPPVPATCIGAFGAGPKPNGALILMDGGTPVPLPPRLGFQHAS
ncbi:thiamine-monophosphate kinase [Sphingomonas sp. Leaf357]|uniref:thiamine-phosphate kinase n=1 Tax=Sphingomonas sp. Leaf357 TaxID=1736350 RepID=UPI0006FF083C|nr:thiamine-phosphate kinase [Sphingomonas sp. Leaf357]KQS02291.1 thiamine-monophosphate kinase [Sphingomonas sp. Leaf357]